MEAPYSSTTTIRYAFTTSNNYKPTPLKSLTNTTDPSKLQAQVDFV